MYQYSLLNYSFLDGNYIIQIKHQEKDQNSFTWLFPYIDVLCFAVLELWWSCEPDSMLDRDHRHWIYFVILMIIMICIFPISWNVHRDFFWMHRNARIVMIFWWLMIKKNSKQMLVLIALLKICFKIHTFSSWNYYKLKNILLQYCCRVDFQ